MKLKKYFLNLVNWNRNRIVFTIFQLIWNQTEFHLVPNLSVNYKYNLIPLALTKIRKDSSVSITNLNVLSFYWIGPGGSASTAWDYPGLLWNFCSLALEKRRAPAQTLPLFSSLSCPIPSLPTQPLFLYGLADWVTPKIM